MPIIPVSEVMQLHVSVRMTVKGRRYTVAEYWLRKGYWVPGKMKFTNLSKHQMENLVAEYVAKG